MNDVTIQAWSPLQKGFFGGPFLTDFAKYSYLNLALNEIAEKYNTTNTAIAIAWIACMPANIQIVTGTTNPRRMKDCCAGSEISLTREEWYRLYTASGNIMP
jgi:predicted oxidoreductase